MSATATFRLVYVFVVLDVGTRRIVHWNAIDHPTAAWTTQQFRMVVSGDEPHRLVIHDHDSIYSDSVAQSVGKSPSSFSTSMRSHSVQLSMIFPAAMRLRVIPVSDLGLDARLLPSNLSEELLAVHRSKTVSSTVLTSSTLT